MKIVFATTQSISQSTVVGRVLPLAEEFQKIGHYIVLLLHDEASSRPPSWDPGASGSDFAQGLRGAQQARNDSDDSGKTATGIKTVITGTNPFSKSKEGKKRQSGLQLLLTMKINAFRAAWSLVIERPDVIILVKPLPENTYAVLLAKIFLWNAKVVLDVDDFELFANKLTSLLQRAAIHASERIATWVASSIVVATPFLYDHMHQMVAGKKNITLIPTGLSTIVPGAGGASADLHPDRLTKHTILYIGSISLASGHRVDLLPEILQQVRKQIPDAHLILAGTGDDEAEIKKQFQELSLENAVTFMGRFFVKDLAQLVEKSDILLDPIDASIVSRAKSSFRCAFALAIGVPIVTSNIGIRTDLLPSSLHEKFFAIPADPQSYAGKVVELMKNPLAKSEADEMRKQSEKYTWTVLAKSYIQQIL